MKSKIIIIFVLIVLNAFNCSDNSSPLQNNNIEIKPIFIGATNIYLKLKLAHTSSHSEIGLYRNDSLHSQIEATFLDTIVADINLNPNKTYSYYATLNDNSGEYFKSNNIELITLDTTSQNFKMEIEHIGEFSSYLKDVEILSKSNIWAVGGINEGIWYGGIIWDGNSWIKKHFPYKGGELLIKDIFCIGDQRKWLTSGSISTMKKILQKYLIEEI